MIENKAGLRIVRPPDANVIPFRSKEEKPIVANHTMEPEFRSGWMLYLKDLDPQEADVAWRLISRQTDDEIGAALGISVDEVHAITKRARSKIAEQIGS